MIITLPLTEILIKVCPHQTRRVYTLTQKETKATSVDKFETSSVASSVDIASELLLSATTLRPRGRNLTARSIFSICKSKACTIIKLKYFFRVVV